MSIGKNERVIQARLNILADAAVMRNWVNLAMQETISGMGNDEAEAFIRRARQEAGIEYAYGIFFIPTGIYDEEKR